MTRILAAAALVVAALATLATAPAMAANCFCLACMVGQSQALRTSGPAMMPAIPPDVCVVVDTSAAARQRLAAGDIVAFRHPGEGAPVIDLTRVVATGGQRVRIAGGRVSIDGKPVETRDRPPLVSADVIARDRCPTPSGGGCRVRRLAETLPNGTGYEVLDILVGAAFDTMAETTVPPGHLFGLGDNRDNAVDSRMRDPGPGFIAASSVIGTVTWVGKPGR